MFSISMVLDDGNKLHSSGTSFGRDGLDIWELRAELMNYRSYSGKITVYANNLIIFTELSKGIQNEPIETLPH